MAEDEDSISVNAIKWNATWANDRHIWSKRLQCREKAMCSSCLARLSTPLLCCTIPLVILELIFVAFWYTGQICAWQDDHGPVPKMARMESLQTARNDGSPVSEFPRPALSDGSDRQAPQSSPAPLWVTAQIDRPPRVPPPRSEWRFRWAGPCQSSPAPLWVTAQMDRPVSEFPRPALSDGSDRQAHVRVPPPRSEWRFR